MSDRLRHDIQDVAGNIEIPIIDVKHVTAGGRRRIALIGAVVTCSAVVMIVAVVAGARTIEFGGGETRFAPAGNPSTLPSGQGNPVDPGTMLRVAPIDGVTPAILVDSPVGDLCLFDFPDWMEVLEIDDSRDTIVRLGEPTQSFESEGERLDCYELTEPESQRLTADLRSVTIISDARTITRGISTPDEPARPPTTIEPRGGAPDEGTAAINRGDLEKARELGEQRLAAAQDPENWDYGNAIHEGNLLIGHAALRGGEVAEASRYLLAAGRTPGSPQLNSFGPNMSLARDLLLKGERQAVLRYFSLVAEFWESGGERLEAWERYVRSGAMPEFGANLVYGEIEPAPIEQSASDCAGCRLPRERG